MFKEVLKGILKSFIKLKTVLTCEWVTASMKVGKQLYFNLILCFDLVLKVTQYLVSLTTLE